MTENVKVGTGFLAGLAIVTLFLALPALDSTEQEVNAQEEETVSRFQVDPVHSSVLFKVKHVDVGHYFGRFLEFDGTLELDEDNPSNSSIDLTVETASVETDNSDRNDHLRSPDFFNVEQFPVITFESTSVEEVESGVYEVTGEFTLHGTTEEITVEVEKTGQGQGPDGNNRVGFETRFQINRSDYGMDNLMGAVNDEVQLIIATEWIEN